MENYLTIKKDGHFSQVIKKSEFICSIARVNSEEEAQQFINQISPKNKKARHNCFAYLIGNHDEIQRESDNGEPAGTAGVPILNALKQNQLHNVCAVVTRYFGGIKLGTGGLIRAYNSTTAAAIREIGVVNRVVMQQASFNLSYADFEKAKYFLNQNQIQLQDVDYTDQVKLTLMLKHDQIKIFQKQLTNYLNFPITLELGGNTYQDIEVKSN
ncbi:MAG TPA: YigZ family protein [Candidatus Ligilactobacillus excrementigallinarum]|uniref:YigZ family protein n=1 Tax=Candidatus Ligilactobacillus excrementigallinarum TaxID=2838641 RepID=A0A9D2AA22_9LACO|nr:YigZ family protein [Candidatus Ligilactobacillus excrementigallinarum]